MELDQLGWNLLTLSLVGTISFSVLGAIGLWKQSGAIWKLKSGKSVSVSYMSFYFCYFAAGLIHSLSLDDKLITLAIHCFGRMAFHVPILIGLWKFKRFTAKEKVLSSLFFLGLLFAVVPSNRETLFLIYSVG